MKEVQLTVSQEVFADEDRLREVILQKAGLPDDSDVSIELIRKSIDARRKPVKFVLKCALHETTKDSYYAFSTAYRHVTGGTEVAIIGMGPAGMFAALHAIENGIKPIIFERGKAIRERRRDLVNIIREHDVNPDSNYCFGEGGAGTYSDGKLYTRSKKRGHVLSILQRLVSHGADANILVEAYPHIGTNKLPGIIENMRNTILEHGGEIHFNSRVTDFILNQDKITGIRVNDNQEHHFDNVILATGHSARDIFELLHKRGVEIEAKSFALGVRVEHPQEIIDHAQYGCPSGPVLPPASYTLVSQVKGRGVYSFCMCPGGIIAPCATANGEVVTNGWSPSKRDNPFANSGIVTEIHLEDFDLKRYGPLAGIEFQKKVEQAAWAAGGKTQKVPAQRLIDFVNRKESSTLPESSYLPGITSYELSNVLPDFVAKRLRAGFQDFGKKIKSYYSNDAVVHATESRTSSPVRIPRNSESLEHIRVKGLYPCGEGAGYAGGIVSAAMDGIKCMEAIRQKVL